MAVILSLPRAAPLFCLMLNSRLACMSGKASIHAYDSSAVDLRVVRPPQEVIHRTGQGIRNFSEIQREHIFTALDISDCIDTKMAFGEQDLY